MKEAEIINSLWDMIRRKQSECDYNLIRIDEVAVIAYDFFQDANHPNP